MWEQTKKLPQVKMLILIALVASFIPFSYMWYDQLTNFKCQVPNMPTNISETNSDDHQKNCTLQAGTHWAMFYGINGMVYGVPLMTILKIKKEIEKNIKNTEKVLKKSENILIH